MPGDGMKWDRRLRRASELAETYPFAKQILLFYSQLTAFQKCSYLQFSSACVAGSKGQSSLPAALDDVDLSYLLTRWRPFLALVEHEAPAALAEFARGLGPGGPTAATALLRTVWPASPTVAIEALDLDSPLSAGSPRESGRDPDGSGQAAGGTSATPAPQPPLSPFERFFASAFLQPFAEFLADNAEVLAPQVRRPTCPYCVSPPLVGVLRPEGEGAKRSLICSFCRTEWDYLRIACPACGECREEKLCVYTTPMFEAVRVEACDTCKAYIKTVDLARNGRAVPEVDELAAIPLTFWAEENGYQKATSNVLFP